jgi:hypothetical protein
MLSQRGMALILGLLLVLPAMRAEPESVLLMSRRKGWIEAVKLDSLEPITRFRVGPLAETVTASSDGGTLFITKALPSDAKGCCALYALNLSSRNMSFLVEPAMNAVPSPNDDRVFMQRGNIGIEVFDGKTLERMPVLNSHALYSLHPSPDGRWLFGVTYSGDQISATTTEGPALHIFDLQRNERIRRLSVPYELPTGTWMDDIFYLLAFDGRQAHLWRVGPDSTVLGSGEEFQLPDLIASHGPVVLRVLAAKSHLFIYEVFGSKLDRRAADKPLAGGVFEFDPATTRVVRHWVPDMHFAQLVAAPDGQALYGLDVPFPAWGTSPRLVKLDLRSGSVAGKRDLPVDVWHMAIGDIPLKLLTPEEIQLSAH